jgi:hypothetical protein
MGFFPNDKRANSRTNLAVELLYNPLGLKADKPNDYLVGTIFDISDSGIGFYTNRPLLNGVNIEMFCKDLWNKPKTGKVRWCKTLNSNFSLAGVAFQ